MQCQGFRSRKAFSNPENQPSAGNGSGSVSCRVVSRNLDVPDDAYNAPSFQNPSSGRIADNPGLEVLASPIADRHTQNEAAKNCGCLDPLYQSITNVGLNFMR
jgi:hypothetical protein